MRRKGKDSVKQDSKWTRNKSWGKGGDFREARGLRNWEHEEKGADYNKTVGMTNPWSRVL